MRKYGVNWLLFYIGFVVAMAGPMFWLSLMYDLLWLSHGGDRGLSRAFMWSGQGVWQGGLVFWRAREQAKQKAKATQAAEGKPFVASGKNDALVFVTQTTPLHVRLRKMFGVGSAVVGGITLAAHLVSGKVGVWQIVVYTFCVPLCFVFGIYLTEKAREPTRTETATADHFSQAVETHTITTLLLPSREEDPVLLSRGH